MSSEPGSERSVEDGFETIAEETKGRPSQAADRARAQALQAMGKTSRWSQEEMPRTGAVGERIGSVFKRQSARLRQGMSAIRSTLDDARSRASELVEEYPLLVGVAAMGIGVLIGLSLPISHREQRSLGPKRQRWGEQAREMGLHPEAASEKSEAAGDEVVETLENGIRGKDSRPF